MPGYNNYQQRTPDDDTEGKLFVGGLAWETTEESIKEYFEKFGSVQEVALKRNKEDPTKHRGFCFVKFTAQEFADAVLSQKEPHCIDGSKVDPKSVCPPGVKPEQRTKKIFVGGLHDQTTEEALTEYFSAFGRIQNGIEFSIDRNTNKRRGFCFIEFANESIVDRIVKTKFHQVAGFRIETKRVLTKQQQAEENARQATYATGARAMSAAAIHTIPGAGYGAQQQMAGLQQYGQPVIYIHPDSLSAIYPQASLNSVGGYQHAAAAAAAAMPATGYSSAMETLYQPYSTAGQNMMARAGTALNVRRQTPYTLKKNY